ncbi:glycosyltransferase [Thalassococcus sp. S3]|uniref:glycosyltransferase n=1 Tax=Thalassococcus sp. S3 TaxID=2017482 RepID=UPI001024401D|nr:glycosyltransferase [Thalassococcus sp. S3]QBF30864.1 glycosyltransferase [Thalassococcus sp. S3]
MFAVLTHIAYFAVIVLLASSVPPAFLGSLEGTVNTIFIIGFLGAWRYSWAAINFTRAVIFRRVVYPRRKAKAQKKYRDEGVISHAYFLVTSYMVKPEVSLPVYRSIFEAAANSKDGATIVSSVVDGADERLIRSIYETMPRDMSNVQLVIDRIEANGKRDAMAKVLRIIRGFCPTHRDILVFVDGDTMVPHDIVAKSAPIFTNPKVGALTTDEAVQIERKSLYRDWFIMRFNQRQVMMCSMGLGNRVLTLTGRMSVFRADLATNPEFIEGVDHDFLDHWRLGRVKFLTGDDKSTWFWLLKNGYEMAYLPDVQSISVEEQPRDTFLDSAQTLMVRWFGNMLRTNGRAIALGPRRIGFFTWWSVMDQRISMWTTLVGPITILLTAILHDVMVIPLYIAWVMATRYVFCIILSMFRGTWFPVTHPLLLYFSQVFGAAVKTFVFFRLDKQKWTRQSSRGSAGALDAMTNRIRSAEAMAHHGIALLWLTIAIMFLTKI